MYDDKLLSIFKFKLLKSVLLGGKITFSDRIINYAKKYNLNPPQNIFIPHRVSELERERRKVSIASHIAEHLFNLICFKVKHCRYQSVSPGSFLFRNRSLLCVGDKFAFHYFAARANQREYSFMN